MADSRLMLHFNGTDGDTATVDATGRHPIITFNGTAQISDANVKMGTGNLLLDGVSDYLALPNSEDWNICAPESDDWTIDFWVKHTDHVGTEVYVTHAEDASNYWRLSHSHGAGLRFHLTYNGTIIIDTGSGGEITDLLYHHVAFCKVGDEYGIYLDGQQVCYTQDASVATIAASLFIGSSGYSTDYFDGRIDELRVDKSNHFNAAPNAGLTDTIGILNPIAHYKLDDNLATTAVLDASGNGYDGTLVGGNNTEDVSTAGKIESAFLLPGSSDYVDIPDVALFDFAMQTDPFSLSIWAKISSGGATLVSKAVAVDIDRQYHLYVASGVIVGARLGGTLTEWNGSGLFDGEWHHYALTVPGSTTGAKLYIDGLEMTSYNRGSGAIGSAMNAGQSINIGGRTDGSFLFNGLLDDVVIFDRVLTAAEVTAIRTAGLAGNIGVTEEYQAYELLPEFPTLSTAPEGRGWTEVDDADAVRHSKYASGGSLSESQFTFDGALFTHRRSYVSDADKITVRDFYRANKSRAFLWLNDHDSLKYQVKFVGPPEFTGSSSDTPWGIVTKLRQINSQVIS